MENIQKDEDLLNVTVEYERVLEYDPESPDVYYNLGLIYSKYAKNKKVKFAYERAIKNFKKYLTFNPEDANTIEKEIVNLELALERVNWKRIEFPDGVYEGEMKNGKLEGKGIMIFPSGSRYEGDFKNGGMDGKGIYSSSDGSWYEGEMKNGEFHGKGIAKLKDGGIYEGDFIKGMRTGKGIYKFPGDILSYEGEFKNNGYHGYGVLSDTLGYGYTGEFKEGNQHGKGLMRWPGGDTYEGEYKDGKFHGKGKLKLEGDSVTYEGDFVNGSYQGYGIFESPQYGYEGEFKDGKFHGKGILISDNFRYEGEFRYDDFNGIGTYTILGPDLEDHLTNCEGCRKYTGQWKNGIKEGSGSCYDIDGKIIYNGKFKDDKPTGKYP